MGLRELIRLLVNTPEHFHLEFNDKIRFRKLMNTRALKMVPVEELVFNPVSDEDRQQQFAMLNSSIAQLYGP